MGPRTYGLAVLLLLPLAVQPANILGLFTSLSPSHLIIHVEMMKTLMEQGHNVTIVTVRMPPHPVPEGIRHIFIPISAQGEEKFKSLIGKMSEKRLIYYDFVWYKGIETMINLQTEFLADKRFTGLYEEQFDIVFHGYFMNLFELGVAAKFKCPVIMNWVGAPLDQTDQLTGNPPELSYVTPITMSAQAGQSLSFKERLHVFLLHWCLRFLNWTFDMKMQHHYEHFFGQEKNFPSYAEAKISISLFFSNYHTLTEGPIRPLLPNFIEVGGLQAKEEPSKLPQDIQTFLDTAKEGVVLLSLGSNVKGSHMKPQSVRMLYEGFAGLKERVIWKWDDLANTPGNASNILYKNWLPQDDILAHPNLKLFITHAGKGGIAEGQYHGVPMLAFPFYGDQFGNAEGMVKAGFGLGLRLLETSDEVFRSALKELLQNPKYANAAKTYSQRYRDRPLTARQSVVYWTEYVLRHKGARHLQTPVLHMSFIESNNLDVYALLSIVFLGLFWLLKRLFSWISAKIRGSPRKLKKN
ncbi:UDP-glucuronosyltransferase 2B13-like [Scaptodrosophila lebanonensis]|uniref:UDP-glucuronosyltransferase 2B13-like n=1 Tax=Drosophila lebanonensis TaxID=7225 RepID=A0A6J2U8K2_DROLE|nr:UDP-glucuronosyltransferase 2B13-like [Scaptodrosophila lebanonensis]